LSDEKKFIIEAGNLEKVDDSVEVGIIDNPESFNVGVSNELGGAILFVFAPEGLPKQALGFRGEAANKLLQTMETLLELYGGTEEVEEESPSWIVPEKKKNPTLH
jgi:hypothetical protein